MKHNVLKRLSQDDFDESIFKGNFGLERENLRVRGSGFISQSKHPFVCDENIDRDFCESQVEIISPVCESIDELYNEVALLDKKVRNSLIRLEDKEYLWLFSNPPYISNEYGILVARYHGLDDEKDKYKKYLSEKYDKKKMIYCGIHFNYSYSEKFINLLFKRSEQDNYAEFKNDMYLNLAKKIASNSWLLVYLTAASPIFDISLEDSNNYGKSCFDGEASMRGGYNGFWNKFIPILDYSNINSYANSLKEYIRKGELYSESELYLPVRIKPKGKNSLANLENYGVDHIELRMFDLNPMAKLGIFKEDLEFIHWFIVYMTLKQNIKFDETDQINAIENHRISAKFDCKDVYIKTNGETVPLLEKALDVLEDMETMFNNMGKKEIAIKICKIKRRVVNPEIRYANQVYNNFKNDYVKKGMVIAKYYSI